jgi:putative nucleotidyltransferase with HDIG domain
VLATGETLGHVEPLGHDSESTAEAMLADEALEVYAPVLGASGTPIGAYELYVGTAEIERAVAEGVTIVWVAVGGVFLGLEVLLIALVRGASLRMRRQTETLRSRSTALMESYRKLEESSLEAIESLNATVEAKDPYTAGHSQRVRQIAIEIGRELGLERDRLDTLATSALFHDIGKLAVPEAILLKPASLDPEERRVMRCHVEEGANIIDRLGFLADAVPAIRHHHERFDGSGYPDGLHGEEIPLGARIIHVADAVDSMVTARVYRPARPVHDALTELRAHSGTQFCPRSVEALDRVLVSEFLDTGTLYEQIAS